MKQLVFSESDFKRLKYRQKINWKIEKLFRFPIFTHNFGIKEAYHLVKQKDRLEYLEACCTLLQKEFADFIQSYQVRFKAIEQEENNMNNENNYIWVCWFQGRNNMPVIVDLCIKSIQQMADSDIEVVVLSLDTLDKYIDIPEYIIKKVQRGTITLTHFSDLVRFELLRKYGGLWVDATCFACNKIPNQIFNQTLYTIRNNEIENDFYSKFTSFLIGGKMGGYGGLFFSFMIEFFYEYHRRYSVLLDWHLINIAYAIAYRSFDEVAYMAESIPANNTQIQSLNKYANDDFSKEVWNNICDTQIFNKMNWRKGYRLKSENGMKTFYGHMSDMIKNSTLR